MGKAAYVGISSLSRKISKLYVGVSGLARKVKKGYIGINGVARVFYTGDPVLIFEQSTAGTYSQTLSAGTYEITLIGGGGGASCQRCSTTGAFHYAQGGVGGTVQVIAKLTSAATVSITVGSGGSTSTSTFSSAESRSISGLAGTASTITGFSDLTLSAASGVVGRTRATSTSACTRTVGSIGAVTVSGTCVQSTPINNPDPCTPSQGSSSVSQRNAVGCPNANWPDDTTRGQGGDCGWVNTTFRIMNGASGYARIRQL